MEAYEHIKTLEEAKKVIAEQDRMIGEQRREILDLRDSESRRNNWLWKAKKDAGYGQNVSFDIVWEETLKKAQSTE